MPDNTFDLGSAEQDIQARRRARQQAEAEPAKVLNFVGPTVQPTENPEIQAIRDQAVNDAIRQNQRQAVVAQREAAKPTKEPKQPDPFAEPAELKMARRYKSGISQVEKAKQDELKDFDAKHGSLFTADEMGKVDNSDIEAMQMTAQDKVGVIHGALSPFSQAGDETDAAKAAKSQLADMVSQARAINPNVQSADDLPMFREGLAQQRARLAQEHAAAAERKKQAETIYGQRMSAFYGPEPEAPVVPPAVAKKVAVAQAAQAQGAPVPPEVANDPEVSFWSEFGKNAADLGRSFGSGSGGLVKMVGDIYGLTTGDMDNATSKFGRYVSEYWNEGKTADLKAREAGRAQAIAAAPSEFGKAIEWVKATASDPLLTANALGEQVPQLLPGMGAGAVGGKVAAKLLLRKAATDALKIAAVARAASIGTKVGVAAGAAMQGADVGGDSYADTLSRLEQMSPEQAAAIPEIGAAVSAGEDIDVAKAAYALSQGRKVGVAASAFSLLANGAIPGGNLLERVAAGKAAGAAATGAGGSLGRELLKAGASAAGEAGGEMVEEGGGLVSSNVAARQGVDPSRPITQGLGETVAQAGFVGALAGGPAAVSEMNVAKKTPPAAPATPSANIPTDLPPPAAETVPDGEFTPEVDEELAAQVNATEAPPATLVPGAPVPIDESRPGELGVTPPPAEVPPAPAPLQEPPVEAAAAQPVTPPAQKPAESGSSPAPAEITPAPESNVVAQSAEQLSPKGQDAGSTPADVATSELADLPADELEKRAQRSNYLERYAGKTKSPADLSKVLDELEKQALPNDNRVAVAVLNNPATDEATFKRAAEFARKGQPATPESYIEGLRKRRVAPAPSAAVPSAQTVTEPVAKVADSAPSQPPASESDKAQAQTTTTPEPAQGAGTVFEQAKAQRDAIEAEVRAADAALNAIPDVNSGPMGLTPDSVKSTPAYIEAKRNFDRAFARQRTFNQSFTKQFKAELAAERAAKRASAPASPSKTPESESQALPKPTAADYMNSRKIVGEDYAGPANSVVIQARGLDTDPLKNGKPIVFPFDGNMEAAGKSIREAMRQLSDTFNGLSHRETIIKATDANGKAIHHFTYNPAEGIVSATTQAELEAARVKLREQMNAAIARSDAIIAARKQTPPLIPRGQNTPAEFVKSIAADVGLAADSEAVKALSDFAVRLNRAAPDAFRGMEVYSLGEDAWKAHPETGTMTPDSSAAYNPETNTLFLREQKVQDPTALLSAIVHEAGHFAEKFALSESLISREWAKLDDAQIEEAAANYNPDDARSADAIRKDPRARKEWVAQQFARVVSGKAKSVPEAIRARFQAFWDAMKQFATKWLGSDFSASTAFDAEVLRVMGFDSDAQPVTQAVTPDVTAPASTVVADKSIVQVPTASLRLSTDVPQFKKNANSETGVVEPLSGEYDPTGNVLQVWRRRDGRLEVISGRHRFDLARRTGVEFVSVQIHDEAAGFDARAAARLDAELNIRDGQGSVADYANYFKNSDVTENDAEARGLLARGKGKAGFRLAREASADLFALHQAGRINDAQAEAIILTARDNVGAQQVGIRAALDGGSSERIADMVTLAKQAADRKKSEGDTGDLFGFDDSAMKEMEAQAALAAKERKELAEQISAVQGAAKRPEIAKKFGVDAKNPKAILAKVNELRARIEALKTNPALAGKTAEPVAAPKPAAPALELREPTDAEKKAAEDAKKKREQREAIEEKAATSLKGDAGDQTKDMFGGGDMALFDAAQPEAAPEPKKAPASAASDALAKARAKAKAAFDLLGTPAERIEQIGFPDEHLNKFVDLAKSFISAEIKTPDALALELTETVGAKARKYTRALWKIMEGQDSSLPDDKHDWNAIYAKLDEPAKPAAPAEEAKPAPVEPPAEILRVVGETLKFLRESEATLQRNQKDGPVGRESAWQDEQKAIKDASVRLAEFRRMAPGNNVDAEAVIASLGGEPDFSRFQKQSEEFAEDATKSKPAPAADIERQISNLEYRMGQDKKRSITRPENVSRLAELKNQLDAAKKAEAPAPEAKPEEVSDEAPADTEPFNPEQATAELAKRGITVTEERTSSGKKVWHLKGKTFDVKDALKSLGARWYGPAKAWTIFSDENPTTKIANALAGTATPDSEPKTTEDTAGDGDRAIEDARLRELRGRLDGGSDERRDRSDAVASVDAGTAGLIRRGLKFGMPADVVDDQIEDISMIASAYAGGKPAFILGNGAGTGKTFVLGGAIREMRAKGAKSFVYVTMNQDLIEQIKADLADFGVSDVKFFTYSEMSTKTLPVQPGSVLIFDEAHNIKNEESARAEKAQPMMASAKFTIFASATPFENPVQAAYLGGTGLFNSAGGHVEWGKAYGATVLRRKFYNPQTGQQQIEETLRWQSGKLEDGLAARQWFVKQGIMVTRPMRLPMEMVESNFTKRPAAQKWVTLYDRVNAAYDDAMSGYRNEDGTIIDATRNAQVSMHMTNTVKRILEASKVQHAIEEANKLLSETDAKGNGKNVVIFVETKADRWLGRYKPSELYQKQNGKDTTHYAYPQMAEMMDEWKVQAEIAKKMGSRPGPAPFAKFIMDIASAMHSAGIEIELPSVEQEVVDALGGPSKVGVYTGSVTGARAKADKEAFLRGEKRVIVATMAKGGTGLSLHDKVGDRPTVQLNINLPWVATGVDQVSGRVARYGLQSKAIINWLFAENIPFERMLAGRVGRRMRDMGALVKGIEMKAASVLMGDFDFDGSTDVKQESGEVKVAESDIFDQAERLEKNRKQVGDQSNGFFETPFPLSALMTAISGARGTLLEPSAGRGKLLHFARKAKGVNVIVGVEFRKDNFDALVDLFGSEDGKSDGKSHHIINGDFLDLADKSIKDGGISEKFDTIHMNPPFERKAGTGWQDMAHVTKAFSMLAPGGRLVAIVGEGGFFRTDKQSQEFRQFLSDNGATVIKLPEDAFKNSGTGVRTRMIVLDQGAEAGRSDIDAEDMGADSMRSIAEAVPARAEKPQSPTLGTPAEREDTAPLTDAEKDAARRDLAGEEPKEKLSQSPITERKGGISVPDITYVADRPHDMLMKDAADIIQRVGETKALESALDRTDTSIPEDTKEVIRFTVLKALTDKMHLAGTSENEQVAIQRQIERLSNQGSEYTRDNTARALSARQVYQRDTRTAATVQHMDEIRKRQDHIIGPDGEKAVDDAVKEFEKPVKETSTEVGKQAKEKAKKVKVSVPVWEAYRADAANRMVKYVDDVSRSPKETAPLADFTARIVAEMKSRLAEFMPDKPASEREKLTPLQILTEAISNKVRSKEVFDTVRAEFVKEFGEGSPALELIDMELANIGVKPYSKPTLDRAVKNAFKAMQAKVEDLAKQHVSRTDATAADLAARLVTEAGLKDADATALAADLDATARAQIADARKKALDRLKVKAAAGTVRVKKVVTALDRVLLLNNLGALSRQDLMDAVAKELKLPTVKPEDLRRISELADKVETSKNDLERARAEYDLMREVAIMKGVKPTDIGVAVWLTNLLSGPMTHVGNLFSNSINSTANLMTLMATNPKQAGRAFSGWVDGFKDGWTHGKDIMRSGIGMKEMGEAKTGEIGNVLEHVDYARDFPRLNRNLATGLQLHAKALRYVSRAMRAADAVFFYPAAEAYARVATAKILEGQYQGKELAGKIRESLGMAPDQFVRFAKQADTEGWTGLDKALRVHQLITAHRIATNPIQHEAANQFGREATYNQAPTGIAGIAYKSASDLTSKLPMMKLFLPFLRTPTNVFNSSLNYTPIGAKRALFGTRDVDGKSTKLFTEDERARLYFQSIAGTLALVGIAAAAIGGADDDDPFFSITAKGTGDFTKNEQLAQTGWRPYTIKVGNRYWNYRDTPFLLPLAAIGHLIDAKRFQKSKDVLNGANPYLNALVQMPATIFETSMLSGLGVLGDIATGNASPNKLDAFFANAASGAAVPNLAKQIDKTVSPEARNSDSEYGRIAQGIPGLRQQGSIKTDLLGKPIVSSPLDRVSTAQTSDTLRETLLEKRVWLSEPSKDTRIDGKNLNGEQYNTFRRLYGEALNRELRPYVATIKNLKDGTVNGKFLTASQKAGKLVDRIETIARQEAIAKMTPLMRRRVPVMPAP